MYCLVHQLVRVFQAGQRPPPLHLSLSLSLPLTLFSDSGQNRTRDHAACTAAPSDTVKRRSDSCKTKKERENKQGDGEKTLACMSEVPALPFCLSFPPCTSSMRYKVQPFTVCLQLASIMDGIMCVSERV